MRKHINKAIVSAVLITSIIVSGVSNLVQPVSAKTDSTDSDIEISTEAVTDSDGDTDIQIESADDADDIVIGSDTTSDDGDTIDDSFTSEDDGITFLDNTMSMLTNRLFAMTSDTTENEQDSVNVVHVRIPEVGGYATVYMSNPIIRTKDEWSVITDDETDIEVDTVDVAKQTYEMKAFPNSGVDDNYGMADSLVFDNVDNSVIHVEVNADEGYHVSVFEVLSDDMSELESVDVNNAKTFEYDVTMPDGNVIIKVVFEKDANFGEDIEPIHGYDYKYTTEERIAYGKYLGVSQWQDADNDYYLIDSFFNGRSGYELGRMGVAPLVAPLDLQNTKVTDVYNSNSTSVSSLLSDSTLQVFTVVRKLYLAATPVSATSVNKVTYNSKISYGSATVGKFKVGNNSTSNGDGITAFCCQHWMSTPAAGSSTGTPEEVTDNNIRRILYYSHGDSWEGKHVWDGTYIDENGNQQQVSNLTEEHWICLTSLALSYYYKGVCNITTTGFSAVDSPNAKSFGFYGFIRFIESAAFPPNNFKVYMVTTNGGTTQNLMYCQLESTPTPQPEYGNFTVKKSWSDNNNQYGVRPSSVTVTLYRDNNVVNSQTLSASNGWSYTWNNLVTKESNGTTHGYRIVENNVPGYTTAYNVGYPGASGGGFKKGTGSTWLSEITNTVNKPETGTFKVTKVWSDSNNECNIRPESVTVTLHKKTKDGTKWSGYQTVTLSESNGWSYTWNNLVTKDSFGTEYTYMVIENNVPGYTIAYNLDYPGYSGGGFKKGTGSTWSSRITNKIQIEYGDITVEKVWDDYDNEFSTRPNSVYVSVYRKAQSATSWTHVASTVLNAANNWSYTWSNLPIKYGNNGLYNYKVVENGISGYRIKYKLSNDNGGGFQQVETTDGSLKYKAEIKNIINVGFLRVLKESALPDITDNNKCYSLLGAKYGVYKDRSCTNKVGEVTTDITGKSDVIELVPGTYYVKEMSASMGYELDTNVYEAEVTVDNTAVVPLEVTVPEQPGNDPAGIEITKIWNGAKTPTIPTLEGTQFTICYYDGYYNTADEVATLTPKRTWVIEAKKNAATGRYIAGLSDTYLVADVSDELYRNTLGGPVIPYGTITIQETKPAAGYTLNGEFRDKKGNTILPNEIYISQVKKENGIVALQGGNVYESADDPKPIRIEIFKHDSDDNPLENVVFEIKDSDGNEVVDMSGNVVGPVSTDTDGKAVFDNLYPNVYVITEVKTVDGLQLLKEPITVYAPMRVTEQEIRDNNIDRTKCVYDEADDIYYIFNLTYDVNNTATFEMPMAGGTFDNRLLIPLGAGMILLGCVFTLVFRKKKRA